MTTLIIGCGYLGRRVGRLLYQRGERVIGTARTSARGEELAAWGIEPVIADVLRTRDHLPEADRAVYCVGFDRSAGVPMRTVYVDGLRQTLDRLAGRVGRLVYVGSTGVYGQNDGGWVDEDSPTEPRHESGRVCLEAEDELHEGPPATIVRCSGLYGPGRIPRRATLERGEPIIGDPGKYLNLIQIDDAARAIVAALDRGESGRLYLATDDRPVERREYYGLAAECLGVAPPRFLSPPPGSPEAIRDESNKRIANRRLKAELGVTLAYPDIRTGLPASMTDDHESLRLDSPNRVAGPVLACQTFRHDATPTQGPDRRGNSIPRKEFGNDGE